MQVIQDKSFIENFNMQKQRKLLAEAHESKLVRIEDGLEKAIENLSANEDDLMDMPWLSTKGKFAFRDGQVTLLAGMNGHMKSTLTCQLLLHVAERFPTGVMSLEMELDSQLEIFAHQAFAKENITAKELTAAARHFTAADSWFYKHYGTVKPETVYGALWAFAAKGCKFLVLDNLQKCGVTSDHDVERDFTANIIAIAKATEMHIVLVHHVRKPSGDVKRAYRPSKYDVRGSGSLTDQPDNVLMIWHNKMRAEILNDQAEGNPIDEDDRNVLDFEHDIELLVEKNRHLRFEGTMKFYVGNGRNFKEDMYGDDWKPNLRKELRPQCEEEADAVNKAPQDAGVNLNDFSWGGKTTKDSSGFELEEY
jgi:twinkle protein